MSWGANRYKIQTRWMRRDNRRKRLSLSSHPENIQARLFESVFGNPSIEYALRVCLRLQSMKRRLSEVENSAYSSLEKYPGLFNMHHLTPRSRKGQSYYGDSPRNLLRLRVRRHKFWHRLFGVLTLEEVIWLLLCFYSRLNFNFCPSRGDQSDLVFGERIPPSRETCFHPCLATALA